MGRYSNILTKYSVTGKKYNETVKYPDIQFIKEIHMFILMKEIDLIY